MIHKNKSSFIVFLFLMFAVCTQAQSVLGTWKTIDDQTGKEKSIVTLYQKQGKLYGTIDSLLLQQDKGKLCTKCTGAEKNKPIAGLEFVKGLKKEGAVYTDGTIFDPKKGKKYRCKMWLDPNNPDKLMVRGYIAFFFRTQTWHRVK